MRSWIEVILPHLLIIQHRELLFWISGEIDWNEFHEVISGNGPCNRERVETRKKAKEDGAWVREAAMAFAEKRKSSK